jgi:hypothetical protein
LVKVLKETEQQYQILNKSLIGITEKDYSWLIYCILGHFKKTLKKAVHEQSISPIIGQDQDIRDTRLLLFDGKSALRRKDVQDIKIV